MSLAETATTAMAATVMAVPSPIRQGRGDAGPEQALGEREHQHQDRARAGPDADGQDRRESAPPAAGAGELARRGPVGMAAMLVVDVVVPVVVMGVGVAVIVMMVIMIVIVVVMIMASMMVAVIDGGAARPRSPAPAGRPAARG